MAICVDSIKFWHISSERNEIRSIFPRQMYLMSKFGWFTGQFLLFLGRTLSVLNTLQKKIQNIDTSAIAPWMGRWRNYKPSCPNIALFTEKLPNLHNFFSWDNCKDICYPGFICYNKKKITRGVLLKVYSYMQQTQQWFYKVLPIAS